ncbi:YihY/virulence factor BrkB family protein [Clostridium hydrogenum]|uniref:YihY/virulence factor BrkB family protein n=1 Tax=Clostridium hydrogenum TaxID=2855764 RepID=UPI001F2FAABE|nr:YihY/virulence factor BrkB family protein [Clostridium hydrogenum]
METHKIKITKLVKQIIKVSLEDDIFALASQLAYSLLFAFFPFLIFVMTLIGFSSIKSEEVLGLFSKIMPYQVYSLIKNTVVEVVDTRNGNLLSFSLIVTIWASISGFNAVIKGLNKAYKENERRGFLKVQMVSLIFTFGLVLVIFSIAFLMVFASVNEAFIERTIGYPQITSYIWDVIKYLILVFGMIFIFAALYRYTPTKKYEWKDVAWGAVFSTVGWIIASFGFSFYVNNFGNYSKLYGSIGTVIVLMLWLFIGSFIVILGGELNSVMLDKSIYK